MLGHSDHIFVRDTGSLDVVRGLLGDVRTTPEVEFCNDVGFIMEPIRPPVLDADGLEFDPATRARPLVGVNVSGLLSIGGYSENNMFELAVDYLELTEAVVCMLVEKHDADVLLVPHVFGGSAESDVSAIDAMCPQLASRHPGRIFRLNGVYDQNEIKYVIGQCDFFIGARMHACIAALSQAVPAIGIAYSDKFAGVFAGIGVEDLVVDPRRCGLQEALTHIGQAFDGRAAVSEELSRAMPAIAARIVGVLGRFV